MKTLHIGRKEDIKELEKTGIDHQIYSSRRNKRGIKRLKYIGDDTGANEAFLETIEEEELSLERQEQEPGTRKRCRRTSPAPSKTSRSPKTSKSPKSASREKRKARKDSKELQTGGNSSGDPPHKTSGLYRPTNEGCQNKGL